MVTKTLKQEKLEVQRKKGNPANNPGSPGEPPGRQEHGPSSRHRHRNHQRDHVPMVPRTGHRPGGVPQTPTPGNSYGRKQPGMNRRPGAVQENQNNRQFILRMPQVLEQVNLSRTTVYKMIGRSEFPQPVRIGQRSVGWKVEEINSWLQSRPHLPPRNMAAAPE